MRKCMPMKAMKIKTENHQLGGRRENEQRDDQPKIVRHEPDDDEKDPDDGDEPRGHAIGKPLHGSALLLG